VDVALEVGLARLRGGLHLVVDLVVGDRVADEYLLGGRVVLIDSDVVGDRVLVDEADVVRLAGGELQLRDVEGRAGGRDG
jgi:hypothetical protein